MKYFIYFLLAASLLPLQAQALRVSNCSSKSDHVVKVVSANDTSYEIELPVYSSRYVSGFPAALQLGGQVVPIYRRDDAYCIWDGKLTIQRRNIYGDKR